MTTKILDNTGSPGTILVFNKNKKDSRRGKILFIDTSLEYEEEKAQNFLREKNIEKIIDAFDSFSDVDKFCNIISVENIVENDYNLNVSLYVDTSDPEPQIDTYWG